MSDTPVKVEHECEEGFSRRPGITNPLGLPGPLTMKQKFYILGPQMIGAAIIDAAANFGIACAMYRSQNNITMWTLAHNTVAGDMGVTTFIQGILTFVIASSMVHVDMRKGTIASFPYPWPDTKFGVVKLKEETVQKAHGKLWYIFHERHGLGRGLHFFSGSATNDLFNFDLTFKQFCIRLFWSAWKGSLLSVLYFLWIWPIAIACTAPHWGGRNMAHTWAPEIIKLIYGFVLGLTMNPVVCCIAMGSEDAVRVHRRELIEQHAIDIEKEAPLATTDGERIISNNPPMLQELDPVFLRS